MLTCLYIFLFVETDDFVQNSYLCWGFAIILLQLNDSTLVRKRQVGIGSKVQSGKLKVKDREILFEGESDG